MKEAERLAAPDRIAELHMLSAQLAVERGDQTGAASYAARGGQAISKVTDAGSRRMLEVYLAFVEGVAHARSGNLVAARECLEQDRKLHNAQRPFENWWINALDAEIASVSRNPEWAEQTITAATLTQRIAFNVSNVSGSAESNQFALPDEPARVKRARGDTAGAIALYRQLLAPDISQKWTLVYEPRYVLEIARLLDQRGEAAAARQEYQRFADLWKNADAGLPELEEARRRLRR